MLTTGSADDKYAASRGALGLMVQLMALYLAGLAYTLYGVWWVYPLLLTVLVLLTLTGARKSPAGAGCTSYHE